MSNSLIADLQKRVQGTTTVDEKPAEAKSGIFGDPKEVPAPTEIPAAFLPKEEPVVAINPPESALPPPTLAAAPVDEAKPKKTRAKRTEAKASEEATAPVPSKDPVGADMHAATTPAPSPPMPVEEAVRFVSEGFTLYVDCLPIGRPAKFAARYIAKAQERMLVDGPTDRAGNKVPDYRLVDYGFGAPAFISFVLDQIDGTEDIVLDTRSPEGAVLLEALCAKAAFVVRGLR